MMGNPNRTFTTGQDLYDLMRKMVEKGDMDEFDTFAYQKWDDVPGASPEGNYIGWLFHVDRIPLIAEWIRGKGDK